MGNIDDRSHHADFHIDLDFFLMFFFCELKNDKKGSEIEGKWVNGTDKVSDICSNAETIEDPNGRLE